MSKRDSHELRRKTGLLWNIGSGFCCYSSERPKVLRGRRRMLPLRHLLNGLIDTYLYYSGRVDTTLPFDELRRRSLINEAAQAADDAPDFSDRIRVSLPTINR
jgi:hypothetical protein